MQAVFIAAGTIFAAVQYLAYRRKERLDRTLELLGRFDMLRHVGVSGCELTAALGAAVVQEAATELEAFKVGWADFLRGDRTTDAAKQYLRASDAAVIVLNYYTDAGRLAEKDLIYLDMFWDARSYVATLALPASFILIAAENRRYNFGALKRFLQQAQDYVARNPVTVA